LINSLPEGIQTELNEHGANFSQGQLQRLAIARSLLRKSLVLLMDEATSALDSQTESKVLENIMVSEPNQVRIITTHRESMLKYCNAVYKITEDGTLEKQ
jgi:ABC-type bacteriocin/lantibiotic exporter with double-glycine peptidase domain